MKSFNSFIASFQRKSKAASILIFALFYLSYFSLSLANDEDLSLDEELDEETEVISDEEDEDLTLDEELDEETETVSNQEEEDLPLDEEFDEETQEDQELEENLEPETSGELPEIEARTYPVKIIRLSKSKRVYLFEDMSSAGADVGKLLLLRRSDSNVMAFKILKTYPDLSQFAAKKVRTYPGFANLPENEEFLGIEKVADIFPEESPEEALKDEADLLELEDEMPETAPIEEGDGLEEQDDSSLEESDELDEEIDELDEELLDEELETEDTEPETIFDEEVVETPEGPISDDPGDFVGKNLEDIMIDEVFPLDPDWQWLSLSFGNFLNSSSSGSSVYYTGVGGRYGVTIGKRWFVDTLHAQDSMVLEAGLFGYKVNNFSGSNDNYMVLPIAPTARYNLQFGKGFILFFNAGVVFNLLATSENSTNTGLTFLQGFRPALGGGFFFRIGPKWLLRADLGSDMLGAGLTIRF